MRCQSGRPKQHPDSCCYLHTPSPHPSCMVMVDLTAAVRCNRKRLQGELCTLN